MKTLEDVSHLTGEMDTRRPKNLVLNEVRFNGQEGKFIKIKLVDRKKDEKAETEDLGESITAIFLKIRRRIGGYEAVKEQFWVSTEHNYKEDMVHLFGPQEKATAESLQAKYPILKAQRVVYAYLGEERELVRLIIKGASLMPDREEQANPSTPLLEYLSQERHDGEHLYQFETKMSAVKKKGKLGNYFAIDFKLGDKVEDEVLVEVVERIKALHAYSLDQDEFTKTHTSTIDAPKIDYPQPETEEEIPFS